jgi:hypothetical protein
MTINTLGVLFTYNVFFHFTYFPETILGIKHKIVNTFKGNAY